MVNILFASKDSFYFQIPGLNVFDEKRNAESVERKGVFICHPPCAQWSRLRYFSNFNSRLKAYGPWSILLVRKFGGIIEHPASSLLFKKYLPLPGQPPDKYGGFSLKITMHQFGASYHKPTWIYIVGINKKDLPAEPLNFSVISHSISNPGKRSALKEISKKERSLSPFPFIFWLVQVAMHIEQNKIYAGIASMPFTQPINNHFK